MVKRVWPLLATLLLVTLLVLLPSYVVREPFYLHILTLTFINIILAASLRPSLLTGQLNIGHSAFVAVGAYTTALLVTRAHIPFEVAILAGGALAVLVGVIIGYPSLRLRGVYFALVTVAFVEVVRLSLGLQQLGDFKFTQWVELTGGVAGLKNLPTPTVFGHRVSSREDYYLLGLALMSLTLGILYLLEKSRIGAIWKAICQAENLAESVGISSFRYKMLAFAIGCFFAGLAGGFLAHFLRFLYPPTFGFMMAVFILIYNFVGGRGSLAGPIVGATFMTLLAQLKIFGGRALADIQFREVTLDAIVFPALLMLVIVFLPGGLIALPERLGMLITWLAPRRMRRWPFPRPVVSISLSQEEKGASKSEVSLIDSGPEER